MGDEGEGAALSMSRSGMTVVNLNSATPTKNRWETRLSKISKVMPDLDVVASVSRRG